MIHLSHELFYDCFRNKHMCKASMANSSRNVVCRFSGVSGQKNAEKSLCGVEGWFAINLCNTREH